MCQSDSYMAEQAFSCWALIIIRLSVDYGAQTAEPMKTLYVLLCRTLL